MNSELMPEQHGLKTCCSGLHPITADFGDMRIMGNKIVVEKGDRYGRLIYVNEAKPVAFPSGRKARMWAMKCDCGVSVIRRMASVRHGYTKSCGCLGRNRSKELAKHGCVKHPAYNSWQSMRARCRAGTQDSPRYHDRGVQICPEWRDSPTEFCKWADRSGFKKGLQLDRRNNELMGERSYSPENCRWVTNKENLENTSVSCWWLANGVRYGSLADAASALGVNRSTVRRRCFNSKFPHYHRQRKYPIETASNPELCSIDDE